MSTWNFTATFDPTNATTPWTFDGVGDNNATIRVGETDMTVVLTVTGPEGLQLLPATSNGELYGQGLMVVIPGEDTQPSWMTQLTRDSDTQFSFVDTDPASTWNVNFPFVVNCTFDGQTVTTPDPTILNLEPSGT